MDMPPPINWPAPSAPLMIVGIAATGSGIVMYLWFACLIDGKYKQFLLHYPVTGLQAQA
jgi:hypothetical protein